MSQSSFTDIGSFDPGRTPLAEAGTEAQRGQMPCPRSHSSLVSDPLGPSLEFFLHKYTHQKLSGGQAKKKKSKYSQLKLKIYRSNRFLQSPTLMMTTGTEARYLAKSYFFFSTTGSQHHRFTSFPFPAGPEHLSIFPTATQGGRGGQENVRCDELQTSRDSVGNPLHKLPSSQVDQMAPLGGVFSGWGQHEVPVAQWSSGSRSPQMLSKMCLHGQSPGVSTPGPRTYPGDRHGRHLTKWPGNGMHVSEGPTPTAAVTISRNQ